MANLLLNELTSMEVPYGNRRNNTYSKYTHYKRTHLWEIPPHLLYYPGKGYPYKDHVIPMPWSYFIVQSSYKGIGGKPARGSSKIAGLVLSPTKVRNVNDQVWYPPLPHTFSYSQCCPEAYSQPFKAASDWLKLGVTKQFQLAYNAWSAATAKYHGNEHSFAIYQWMREQAGVASDHDHMLAWWEKQSIEDVLGWDWKQFKSHSSTLAFTLRGFGIELPKSKTSLRVRHKV